MCAMCTMAMQINEHTFWGKFTILVGGPRCWLAMGLKWNDKTHV